jgi:hypothetical protein
VYFRAAATRPDGTESALPSSFVLEEAHHTVIFLMVDAAMVRDWAKGWGDYVSRIRRDVEASDQRHRIIPMAVGPYSFRVSRQEERKNFLRLYQFEPGKVLVQFAIAVLHELCRVLEQRPPVDYLARRPAGGDRLIVFISHTKVGSIEGIAERVEALVEKHRSPVAPSLFRSALPGSPGDPARRRHPSPPSPSGGTRTA